MKSTLFLSMLSLCIVSSIAFSVDEPGPVIPQQTPTPQQETLLQKAASWINTGKAALDKAQTTLQTLNQTTGAGTQPASTSSILSTLAGLFGGSQTPPAATE